MARTRWPPGREPWPLAQARQHRTTPPVGAKGTWARPTGRIRRQPAASAESKVRPGPRPPTLRPHQAKPGEAGPAHLSTSSLPIRNVYYSDSQLRAATRRLTVRSLVSNPSRIWVQPGRIGELLHCGLVLLARRNPRPRATPTSSFTKTGRRRRRTTRPAR